MTSNDHFGPWGEKWGDVMECNAIFNNILVISWWLVLLVEETEVPEEDH